MTWVCVPVSELYKLPLFGYIKIIEEDGMIIYHHRDENFTIIVDKHGMISGDETEAFTVIYLDNYDDFREF